MSQFDGILNNLLVEQKRKRDIKKYEKTQMLLSKQKSA